MSTAVKPATPAAPTPAATPRSLARGALIVGALGVVFGDIGTSPIYTIQTIFNPADAHPVPPDPDSVRGLISLVFWSVTIIVTIKYVLLVLRADNNGEGGILSLITVILRGATAGSRRTKVVLAGLGIFGASLFLADSMITPAISVLSAVEGLKVVQPSLEVVVIPVTAVIIVVLFAAQKAGTAVVGRFFGPVMIAWFTVIGLAGVLGIAVRPEILLALLPTYAVQFLVTEFGIAFFALAAVVLAVTGAEALYADLGHFGRPPIARAWLFLVFPACILSYLGQGALILNDPATITSPFFLLVPAWARLPLVVLATAATVIASQAVISGAYSVAQQAIQLGYLPRLRIRHTSAAAVGQIYVPFVNWALMIMVLVLVFSFRSSHALAYAFGMAVTGTIVITTVLFFYYAHRHWRWPLGLVLPLAVLFAGFELLFLAANLTKIPQGAWLPLLIGVVLFTVMTTWQRGRRLVTARRESAEGSLQEFVDGLHERRPMVERVPGTAVFLNRGKETAPLAMRANVERNHVLHEHVVILSVETEPVPYVARDDRVRLDNLGYSDDGISFVSAHFGYMERPDVPDALGAALDVGLECPLELDSATYFLSTIELTVGEGEGMPRWQKRLFVATSGVTADAADYFRLPRDRTLTLGSKIEV